jgi:hypothetical protein
MDDVTPEMIAALNACRLHRFAGDIIDNTRIDDSLYTFLDDALEHSMLAMKSHEGLQGQDDLISGLIEEKKDIQQRLLTRKNDTASISVDTNVTTMAANDIDSISTYEILKKQKDVDRPKEKEEVISSVAEKIEGYLKQEQMLISSDIAESQSQNSMLMEELLELTGVLNANMTHINETVNEQVPKLEILQHNIVANSMELNKQKESMSKKAEDMNTSWWTLIKLIVYLLVVFALCTIVIRIF